MTRWLLPLVLSLLLSPVLPGQQKPALPPEEEESAKPKEYSFNPLQAQKEVEAGKFYFKAKKNYKAAEARFLEATRWDNTSAEAFLCLGESEEKLGNKKAAHDAYGKFLELAPNDKRAPSVKKKLGKK